LSDLVAVAVRVLRQGGTGLPGIPYNWAASKGASVIRNRYFGFDQWVMTAYRNGSDREGLKAAGSVMMQRWV